MLLRMPVGSPMRRAQVAGVCGGAPAWQRAAGQARCSGHGAREGGEAAGGRAGTLHGAVAWERHAAASQPRKGGATDAGATRGERPAREVRVPSSVWAFAATAVLERDLPSARASNRATIGDPNAMERDGGEKGIRGRRRPKVFWSKTWFLRRHLGDAKASRRSGRSRRRRRPARREEEQGEGATGR